MADENPVAGTAYDAEFEADYARILKNKGLVSTEGEIKDMMREAWQHGWSTGFGWQGKVEEGMVQERGPSA